MENRTRLLFEIVKALTTIWGPDRIGLRMSPMGKLNDIHDDNAEATFGYVAERLSEYSLAYLHMVNPALEQMQNGKEPHPRALGMAKLIRSKFKGTLIAAGGFDAASGSAVAARGMGRPDRVDRKFLANFDLPERLRLGAALNADDPNTYYGGGEKGNTDYPSLAQDRGWPRTAANSPRHAWTKAGDNQGWPARAGQIDDRHGLSSLTYAC